MQILGKRSKVLLIAIAVVMLVAIGVSFAAWDSMSTVKATSGDLSSYANAKVGDIIEFGKYYQTGKRINSDENAKYEKTAIEWIVVDKDERTGQLTLMSEKILAVGSYFGNIYYNRAGARGYHYGNNVEIANNPYNQAYVESTARAFLNNLERRDLGGDTFDATKGYIPSDMSSSTTTGLLSSVGFSNQKQYTYLNKNTATVSMLPGFSIISNSDHMSFQRPIEESEYQNRPTTLGFYDEAFTDEEKTMIEPKVIAGYIGHRWPDGNHGVSTKSYVEGAVDKVWLPSAPELNIMEGLDWYDNPDDTWRNPSDEASSTVFEYFKNYKQYTNPVYGTQNTSLADAIKTTRTLFAENGFAMNYSIPVYKYQSTVANSMDDIHEKDNSTNHYWTRTPSSYWYASASFVYETGHFGDTNTRDSNIGVRPCVILKY